MPPTYWVGFAGLAIQTWNGKPLRWWNSVTLSPNSYCSFSLPNQRGMMNYQHFLRDTNVPANYFPLLLLLTSTPHSGFQRDTTSPQRKTELWLQTWMFREVQKTCCSTGRSQTAPGLSWKKALSQFQKCCSLCPLVYVCAAHPIRKSLGPTARWCCEQLWRILPPRGTGNVSYSVCHVLKAWGRLGFLSVSFLQQIFVDFPLCPHHSSPSCQGRQACGWMWASESSWEVMRAREWPGERWV